MIYLIRHVRNQLAGAGGQAWYDLGRELIPDAYQLEGIELNTSGIVTDGCSLMFKTWLNIQLEPSWGQLIEGLEKIGLNALAAQIEDMLEPSVASASSRTTTTTVSQTQKGTTPIVRCI